MKLLKAFGMAVAMVGGMVLLVCALWLYMNLLEWLTGEPFYAGLGVIGTLFLVILTGIFYNSDGVPDKP